MTMVLPLPTVSFLGYSAQQEFSWCESRSLCAPTEGSPMSWISLTWIRECTVKILLASWISKIERRAIVETDPFRHVSFAETGNGGV